MVVPSVSRTRWGCRGTPHQKMERTERERERQGEMKGRDRERQREIIGERQKGGNKGKRKKCENMFWKKNMKSEKKAQGFFPPQLSFFLSSNREN